MNCKLLKGTYCANNNRHYDVVYKPECYALLICNIVVLTLSKINKILEQKHDGTGKLSNRL